MTKRVRIIPKPEPELEAANRRARRRETMRSGGQGPYQLVKPVVFFAGGFPPLHEAFEGQPLPEDANALDFGEFFYGGPFAVGAGTDHREIWDLDRALIDGADLILAYIRDCEAFGTLVEIGWAAARGKPVAIGFSDDLSSRAYRELWLCRMLAARIYFGSPAMVWRDFEDDWIMTR